MIKFMKNTINSPINLFLYISSIIFCLNVFFMFHNTGIESIHNFLCGILMALYFYESFKMERKRQKFNLDKKSSEYQILLHNLLITTSFILMVINSLNITLSVLTQIEFNVILLNVASCIFFSVLIFKVKKRKDILLNN